MQPITSSAKMSKSPTKIGQALLLSLFLPLLMATHAMGAVILWDAVPIDVNVNDSTQVFTDGTLVAAATAYGASVTVTGANGINVTFQQFGFATNFTPFSGSVIGQAVAPTTTYSQIVAGADLSFISTGTDLNPSVFSNLLPNHNYKLEVWTPNWNGDYPTRFSSSQPNGATPGVAADESPIMQTGNGSTILPQLIFGTFTTGASETTQNLYMFGVGDPALMGAVQLRDLGAVPEPQTWALASLGVFAVVFRLRRRQERMI